MARKTLKGETFTWHHVVNAGAADFAFAAELFDMTPRDRALLARDVDVPRFYNRGDWHIIRFHIPSVMAAKSAYERLHLTLMFSKTTVMTLTDGRIPPLEVLIDAAAKKRRTPNELRSGAVGDVVVWLLAEVFDALDPVLEAVLARVRHLQEHMRRERPERVTKELGRLRRDVLMLDLMVDPGHAALLELLDTRTPYRSPRVTAAVQGLADRLRAMHAVLEHCGHLTDVLFREHESVLTHRTNQTVQMLTVISVLLMPPTLVASYYGMNVAGLPWAHDIRLVTGVIAMAVALFLLVVLRMTKR